MTQVSMAQVKELRDRTQAGLNDCRGALKDSEGDMEAAVQIILKKGLAKSAKRAGAVASEGIVAAAVSSDSQSGVIVEVNIQTDFAARNEDFLKFVDDVVAIATKSDAGAELGAQAAISTSGTLEEERQALVGRLGENVTIRRWNKLAVAESGKVHSYVHMGGKIGVVLSVETGDAAAAGSEALSTFLEDTAMQIAAMAPQFVDASVVPDSAKATQSELFDAQLKEEGKPDAVRPKIIEGKLGKWLKEICLLDQPSVLDGDKTIDQIRAGLEKEIGSALKITDFVRYERGEGIEAPAGEDFADEARRMAGQG